MGVSVCVSTGTQEKGREERREGGRVREREERGAQKKRQQQERS